MFSWEMFNIFLFLPVIFGLLSAQCPKLCSRNGKCINVTECDYSMAFIGSDYSERLCPRGIAFSDYAHDTNKAHLSLECSGRGICNTEIGMCSCGMGYTGSACERLLCPNRCSHRGRCVSKRDIIKDRVYRATSIIYNYSEWDSNSLYGCICDHGYTGYDCSLKQCTFGDDPLTFDGEQETQLLRCTLDSGILRIRFDNLSSENIHSSSSSLDFKSALERIPSVGRVKVSYSIGSRLCSSDGANVVRITFLEKFGPLPPLNSEIIDNGTSNTSSVIDILSHASSSMRDGLGRLYMVVKGSKDNIECSNRGLCNHDDGVCDCFQGLGGSYGPSDGYGHFGHRDDCGYIHDSVSNCPSSCSNRGSCNNSTFTCSCQVGFSGPDCSMRKCPKALSWFSDPSLTRLPLLSSFNEIFITECSDMGLCNLQTGECNCNVGFEGEACHYMACLGTRYGRIETCSGHGQCLSMRQLAHRNKLNGVAFPLDYGTEPFSSSTWDADKIFGCHCDDGYDGFDCSLKL